MRMRTGGSAGPAVLVLLMSTGVCDEHAVWRCRGRVEAILAGHDRCMVCKLL